MIRMYQSALMIRMYQSISPTLSFSIRVSVFIPVFYVSFCGCLSP